MDEWPVQDAKARFSEMLEAADKRGPQLVTKRGEKKAVLVPVREWERLTQPPRRNAIEVLLAPEARIDDLPVPDRRSYRSRKVLRF
jgi:prevent-host-death family protein